MTVYSRIAGTGSYLPEKILTNADLEKIVETSDQWIRERTGIQQRHIAAEGQTTVDLAEQAALRAMEAAGVTGADLDLIVMGTTTPDIIFPSSACLLQARLGATGCPAFDVNAACSGFVYALVTAHGLLAMGAERILLIGTDTLARITDWSDRNTAVLFADGSGAAVLEHTGGTGQMLGWDLDADGSAEEFLYCDLGGFIRMDGKEVFRRAVRIMVDSAHKSMAAAGVTVDELSLVVPHQANIRIVSAACERLGIPMDRAAMVIQDTGNTSSASIPLALFDAADKGRLADGDLVLLVGFGAGMTAASAVLKWGAR